MDTQDRTFTVEAIKAPEGNKPGAIKTDEGAWITAWPAQFKEFQQGRKYRATVYNKPYNGKDQWTVSKDGKIEVLDGNQQSAPKTNGNGATHTAPVSDYESAKQEAIYICGVVNSAINAGKVTDANTLQDWTNMALTAWRNRSAQESEVPY